MSLNEKHIRNIFIYILPRFANYGINLITLPILTRLLTPEDFGRVVLAWAFPTIAVSVLTLGLVPAVQRYYFEYRKEEERLNALIFSLQVYLYTCMLIAGLGVFLFKDFISLLVIKSDKYGLAVFLA